MADAGEGSSSGAAARVNDTENRYFGELALGFGMRHRAWQAENHLPQTAAQYAESLNSNQTNTCTRIAALKYQRDNGVQLENITGIDSHVFYCKWVSADDHRLCFHVNFHASIVGRHRSKSFFFAEVLGANCPEFVSTCVMMETRNEYSVKNCVCCTGIWHPVSGGFLGYKSPPAASSTSS